MNDNRKLSLGLVSILGILTTAMTFLYRQPSPFWVASQAFLLLGMVIFLGMAMFLFDARNFKLFAIPVVLLAFGELFSICSQFRFQLGGNGIRMESLAQSSQPLEVLVTIVGVLQFVILAWTIIDISTDFLFSHGTFWALFVCFGLSAMVDLILFSTGLRNGFELIRMYSVYCLSDILAFGTVTVFYFTYTKERRLLYRYYKTQRVKQSE